MNHRIFNEAKADFQGNENELSELFSYARKQATSLAITPVNDILGVLQRTGEYWNNTHTEEYKTCLERLPQETGFSLAMISEALNALPVILSEHSLAKKVDEELPGMRTLGGYLWDPRSRRVTSYQNLGVVFHVLAGNVFLGAVSSLVEGVLTRNANIFRMASGQTTFLPLFIETLKKCDPLGIVWPSLTAVAFPSAATRLISIVQKETDGLVVWGGEQAVQAWRRDLPARTRLIVFGPKYSFALATEAGLSSDAMNEVARKLAVDISSWDQNACTAPQLCFVQGSENAQKFAKSLALSLSHEAERCTPGEVDFHTGAEIQKLRSTALISEARGIGSLHDSKGNLAYTVIVTPELSLEPSPLHRTVRVVPFDSLDLVLESMTPLRGYVQSVGLGCLATEQFALADQLFRAGAVRVVPIGEMGSGDVADPHDGQKDLPQLVRTVFHRVLPGKLAVHPVDLMPRADLERNIEADLRSLLRTAAKSPFYAERISHLGKWPNLADLSKMPPLRREEIDVSHVPMSQSMQTSTLEGGYVSRSGGSTGEPKFSVYDAEDWEQMMSHSVRIFQAMGLEPTDRLANCMLAGDLYGSFVSFDQINVRVGTMTFAFAQQVSVENLLPIWRSFALNSIQGVPSIIVPVLRKCREMEPSFAMEKVFFAGQPMSLVDRTWLKDVLGVKVIASVIGANDGGPIAYQCSAMQGAEHHTVDDYNWIEITDEDGTPVPEGEPGRILITSLKKRAIPLIRYDLGDRARLLPGACSCGRTTRRIEFLGRADDVVSAGLINFRFADLRAALQSLPVSEMQVRVRSVDGNDEVTIRLETETPSEAFLVDARAALLSKVTSLAQRLEEGALAGLLVEGYSTGTLPRNSRTGKIKQVLDERN